MHPVGVAPLGVFVIFRVLLKRVTWPRGREGEGGTSYPLEPRYRICTTRIHYCNPAVCVFCALFERERTRLRFLSMERSGRPLGFSHTCPTGLLCERNAGPLLCRETMRHSRSADHSTGRRERERGWGERKREPALSFRRITWENVVALFLSFYFFFFLFLFHLYSLFFLLSFYSRPSRCFFFFFRPSIGISMWGCSRINRA